MYFCIYDYAYTEIYFNRSVKLNTMCMYYPLLKDFTFIFVQAQTEMHFCIDLLRDFCYPSIQLPIIALSGCWALIKVLLYIKTFIHLVNKQAKGKVAYIVLRRKFEGSGYLARCHLRQYITRTVLKEGYDFLHSSKYSSCCSSTLHSTLTTVLSNIYVAITTYIFENTV